VPTCGAKEMNIFIFAEYNCLGDADQFLCYDLFDFSTLKFIGFSKEEVQEQIFSRIIEAKYRTTEKELVKYIEEALLAFFEKSFTDYNESGLFHPFLTTINNFY